MRCVFPLLRATLPQLFAPTESLVEVDSNNFLQTDRSVSRTGTRTLRSHDGCPD